MWRLAHAHCALLGVVNILYALTYHHKPLELTQGKAVSTALIMATILLPGGFLLGGIMPMDGDPGIAMPTHRDRAAKELMERLDRNSVLSHRPELLLQHGRVDRTTLTRLSETRDKALVFLAE